MGKKAVEKNSNGDAVKSTTPKKTAPKKAGKSM
jgi:hypothetical protein